MIKLLAVDMDGTCLDPKSRMTDATLGALSLAAKAGIRVVPTTGRTLGCLPHRLVGRSDIFRASRESDLRKRCPSGEAGYRYDERNCRNTARY